MRSVVKLPYYKQVGNLDCGPTCLRMVAEYYGMTHSVSFLRRLVNRPSAKFSMFHLSQAASQIGFSPRGVKITFNQLCKEKLPCIIHWKKNHFVVVYRIKRLVAKRNGVYPNWEYSKYIIQVADPALGLFRCSKSEFIRGWISDSRLGIALLIKPNTRKK